VADVLARFGQIGVMVHNSGINNVVGEDTAMSVHRRLME
jgi:hypothetical protein